MILHSPSAIRYWLFAIHLVLVGTLSSSASADEGPPLPAEEIRLNADAFRQGLKRRGLTEFLEQHLREFPPASAIASALLLRDLKLAEAADPTLPSAQRRAAMAQANRALEELLEQEQDHPKRFEWWFTLGHALLYDEAEPLFTKMLYLGGSGKDRTQLRALTSRALFAVTTLTEQLSLEYTRIDAMSLAEFERLERSGYIEEIDRLVPKADYLLLWTLYYDALSRTDTDTTRAKRLNRIMLLLKANRALLNTRHEVSGVEVQALLLAGMTYRLVNDHPAAREHFNRALAAADRIDDPAEQQRVEWAVRLARIESVRNETDDGRFDEARRTLSRFRKHSTVDQHQATGLMIVAALLERSIFRASADAAAKAGRLDEAATYRNEAWQPLLRLVQRHQIPRDEIYATLYELIGPDADPNRLDPFEQVALIGGLVLEANEAAAAATVGTTAQQSDAFLQRAVDIAERFLTTHGERANLLVPEVRYNLAVAQYRLGRAEDAAGEFLIVAQQDPSFDHALQAAAFAVQLAGQLYGHPSIRSHSELGSAVRVNSVARSLYRESLDTLVNRYSGTDEARYYRFFYAQLLEELGEYDAAAAEYASVDSEHEHFVESAFLRVRCLALVLQNNARDDTADTPSLRRRVSDFLAVQRGFVSLITSKLGSEPNPDRVTSLTTLHASARLLVAEVEVLPQVDRPGRALETLDSWETAFPNEQALAGRVWRVRVIAYDRLGRLEEVAQAIPVYLAVDPDGAGATLQSLYESLVADVEKLLGSGAVASAPRGGRAVASGHAANGTLRGGPKEAQQKAEMALVLAEQIHDWAVRNNHANDMYARRSLTLQRAEANLRAGRHERARDLFETCLATPVEIVTPSPRGGRAGKVGQDPRAVYGYAEALFQLGEFAQALPLFNRLAVRLPPADALRWKALLRDLESRTALGEPARGIIHVIQQQEYLYPKLGGPDVARRFQRLLRENQRRPVTE